ncbi:MAG: NAD(P)/FAD-dependent oxidoreductase [Candidatus Zixiibacteriota bacterium]
MTSDPHQSPAREHHVVIIGGGFGGLYAAQALKKAPVRITLIDKRNFHLFQPLLYQVATGGLSPGDIASPLRGVLNRQNNVTVLLGEVTEIDCERKQVRLRDRLIAYDSLIVATGSQNSFFGHDDWQRFAPGLKGIEDALAIRGRIYQAFEAAESADDPAQKDRLLTFVIVGGGATGVELAGAIGEIAHIMLKRDFRTIDTSRTRIILLEAGPRILPTFPEKLATAAVADLARLGATVQTESLVTQIDSTGVTIKRGTTESRIEAGTIMWSAGVKPSPLGRVIAGNNEDVLDRNGRVIVQPDLSVPGHPDAFVLGDLANFSHQTGQPLPGVAPVAMSQGRYVAKLIANRVRGKSTPPYHYFNKGNFAVIGRAAAIADFGWLRVTGYPAWLVWLFVHLMYLVEYDNRLLVLIQWAWNYFTRNRSARLITYSVDQ